MSLYVIFYFLAVFHCVRECVSGSLFVGRSVFLSLPLPSLVKSEYVFTFIVFILNIYLFLSIASLSGPNADCFFLFIISIVAAVEPLHRRRLLSLFSFTFSVLFKFIFIRCWLWLWLWFSICSVVACSIFGLFYLYLCCTKEATQHHQQEPIKNRRKKNIYI